MAVKEISKDPDNLTMSVISEFEATPERVWKLWADPRQLERWWGPPTYPATVTRHEFSPGGKVEYYMTGPEGERYHGYWKIIEVNEPHRFIVEDGFANEDGSPNDEFPATTLSVLISDGENGKTTMAMVTTFPSTEAMEQLVAMGMDDGIAAALDQIEPLLLENPTV